MKNLTLILLLLISFGAQAQQNPEKEKHVILISIDGLRPEFYLDSLFPSPFIQKMAREGVHAREVLGVFPSVTYPSHTTILTGALPARHGIYYNSPFEPAGATGRWYWEEELIKCKTLWDAVQEAGLTSGSVSWPVSVDAPIDYNIPELFPTDRTADRFAPMRDKTRPKGMMEEIELQATGKLDAERFDGNYHSRDMRIGQMASFILEKYKPNLLTVHLIGVDHFQHVSGRRGEKVMQAIQSVDHAIGLIYETALRAGMLKNTTFIITGDHGFVDIHSALAPNVWLAESGLIDLKNPWTNWKARFHTSGASAFLYLKDPSDKKTMKKVNEVLAAVPEEYKKLFRVLNQDELAKMGASPEAILALAPAKGISMTSRTDGGQLQPAKGGTHGFTSDFPEIRTGFIAFGSGVSNGNHLQSMGLQDIAPVIAKLLNLPFIAPDGHLPPVLKR